MCFTPEKLFASKPFKNSPLIVSTKYPLDFLPTLRILICPPPTSKKISIQSPTTNQ